MQLLTQRLLELLELSVHVLDVLRVDRDLLVLQHVVDLQFPLDFEFKCLQHVLVLRKRNVFCPETLFVLFKCQIYLRLDVVKVQWLRTTWVFSYLN